MNDIIIKAQTRFVVIKSGKGEIKGIFHKFTDQGNAIIEITNGIVMEVNASSIQFKDAKEYRYSSD